ncbi:hypothetical protein KM043_012308 [Ampulex compressa]|nr:hypothetical protein KM043_012308 [Ampulex compressa]
MTRGREAERASRVGGQKGQEPRAESQDEEERKDGRRTGGRPGARKAKQSRAKQSRAEQSRAEQSRAEQSARGRDRGRDSLETVGKRVTRPKHRSPLATGSSSTRPIPGQVPGPRLGRHPSIQRVDARRRVVTATGRRFVYAETSTPERGRASLVLSYRFAAASRARLLTDRPRRSPPNDGPFRSPARPRRRILRGAVARHELEAFAIHPLSGISAKR